MDRVRGAHELLVFSDSLQGLLLTNKGVLYFFAFLANLENLVFSLVDVACNFNT